MSEINVEASSGGRRFTLDPILDREPLPIPVRRVENTLPAGLRMNWIDGESTDPDDVVASFDLTSGAGCGSPYMCLHVILKDGTRIEEVVDMRDVIGDWIEAAVAAGPSPDLD